MSFLDDQATGQIGIGEKASLSTLTRRKRKRKRGQAPTGAETYSLLPQNEFSNLVSSPTDITQVGIGKKLQAQGTAAGDVPNGFDEYVSAAPKGTTLEAIYYQPPPDDDDDPGDDDDLPSVEDDPYIPDADPGLGEGNPLGGTSAFNNMNDIIIAAQKAGLVKGKTGYESKDPEAGGYGFQATLPPSASKAYEDYTFGTGEGKGSMGAGTGGRGGSANMTDDDVAAMNAAIEAGGASGGLSIGEAAGLGSESSTDSMDVTMPDLSGDDLGTWGFASGGTVKAKNKNSFMSMKGK